MSDTIDRLVRMLDGERAALQQAKPDRMIGDRAVMHGRADLDLARRNLAQAESDLEIAEKKIVEWEAFAEKNKLKTLSAMPGRYYRSGIPF